MAKVTIIGGGQGGKALLEILKDDKSIDVVAIVDNNEKPKISSLAKKLKIPIHKDYKTFLKDADIDLIVNVTGNPKVAKDLEKIRPPKAEVIGGISAKFLWDLIEQRRKVREQMETRLQEHKVLNELGVRLSRHVKLKEIFLAIVDKALELTKSPAGSLVIYDEASDEMYFGAAKGFSESFMKEQVWRIRKGGLIEQILNADEPVIVSDSKNYEYFNSPTLVKEKIKSLIAVPLKTEGKIQGILFVDDFKVRDFDEAELSILSLLGNMAALAIQKTKILESTKQLAITDELTHLYNLRHFLNRLDKEINRSKRYHRSLSLAMIDIDFFKKYNDSFGHQEGNKVLKKVAIILQKQTRDNDVVARFGGEEFSVIMPETNAKRAHQYAERARKKVETELCEDKFGECVTISIGVASFPHDAENATDLLERADEALYAAKKDGRNKVKSCKLDKQLELYDEKL